MKVFIALILLFSFKAQAFTQDLKIFPNQYAAYNFIIEDDKYSTNPLILISLRDKAYEKAGRVIREIMEAYRALYPRLTYGLPDPYPIIIKDDSLNAFVFTHTHTREGNPFVVMIFSGLFKEDVTGDEFFGIIAHELAHLLKEHSKKEVVEKLEIFYEVEEGEEEPLGFREQNDLRVEKLVEKLLAALKYKNHGLVADIKDNYDLNNLRIYSTEEQADDFSIRILDFLGRDPTSIGKFMLRYLSPENKEKCLLLIEQQKRVPYGKLYHKHRGDCWRYDHAIRLAENI